MVEFTKYGDWDINRRLQVNLDISITNPHLIGIKGESELSGIDRRLTNITFAPRPDDYLAFFFDLHLVAVGGMRLRCAMITDGNTYILARAGMIDTNRYTISQHVLDYMNDRINRLVNPSCAP